MFYYLTGRLGSGKNLVAVDRIRDYLRRGRPVATNINLDLAVLLGRKLEGAGTVYRLPDFPSAEDFAALGEVDNDDDEEENGLIVLDEGGMMLNARQWGDGGRQAIIKFFLHTRKLGWDVIVIAQSLSMVDKQLREACSEYVITMRRWDRMAVPFLGFVAKIVTFGLWKPRFPRVHTAAVMYGTGQSAMHADTWHVRGTGLFGAYPTKQRFSAEYEHGTFCMMPGSSLVPVKKTKVVAVEPPAQRVAQRSPPKPKLLWVQRIERLPVSRRFEALRTVGLAS